MKAIHYTIFFNTLILLLLNSCTFEQEDDTPLVVERVDLLGDTIAPWGILIFNFNIPISDTNAVFSLFPDPGPIYSCRLNSFNDTLYMDITGILSGNVLYSVKSDDDISAENGTVLLKDDIQFSFYTGYLENEPNNSLETADTLQETIYGAIEAKNDDDYFIITDSSLSEIKLINNKKKCGFYMLDKDGTTLSVKEELGDTLSEVFSSNSVWPLYIKVFSLIDSDSRYQLEVR